VRQPIHALWPRWAHEPPLLVAADLSGDAALEELRGAGILLPAPPAHAVHCGGCGERAELVWVTESGANVPYSRCARCGPDAIVPNSLLRWVIDLQVVAKRLALLIGSTSVPAEVLPNAAWHLGRLQLASARPAVYLLRSVGMIDESFRRSLQDPRKSVLVLLPTEHAVASWPGAALALESLTTWSAGVLTFVKEWRAIADSVFKTIRAKKDKVHPKRGIRLKNIEVLTKFLRQYVKDMRECATTSFLIAKTTIHLPPLTQKELGERVGLDESTVSRCLADEDAFELRVRWEEMSGRDPDAVLQAKDL
jgi:hypothetical protein